MKLKSFLPVAILLSFSSCNRDPHILATKYLQSGNKYFQKGMYKEARIMYRTALRREPKYGLAHYQLAQVEVKLGNVPIAVGSLRRALERLGQIQPRPVEYMKARILLADLYVLARMHDDGSLREIEDTAAALLLEDRNSFDGHRLRGDLAAARWAMEESRRNFEKAKGHIETATAEYRQASAILPFQNEIRFSLARALAFDRQFPEAEAIYTSTIAKDEHLVQAYLELARVFEAQKQYGQVEETYRKGFAANPNDYDLLMGLARFYYQTSRPKQAIDVLQKVRSHAHGRRR